VDAAGGNGAMVRREWKNVNVVWLLTALVALQHTGVAFRSVDTAAVAPVIHAKHYRTNPNGGSYVPRSANAIRQSVKWDDERR